LPQLSATTIGFVASARCGGRIGFGVNGSVVGSSMTQVLQGSASFSAGGVGVAQPLQPLSFGLCGGAQAVLP
jgi:hypothetical protein